MSSSTATTIYSLLNCSNFFSSSSGVFQFKIGPDRASFTVHKEIISSLSTPLQNLIAEAKDECAILNDVHRDTFVRFCQYAYFGQYDPHIPNTGFSSKADASSDGQSQQNRLVKFPNKCCRSKRVSGRKTNYYSYPIPTVVWKEFSEKNYGIHPLVMSEGSDGTSATQNLELLCHAELYCFANKYDIPRCRMLCLHKLHRALSSSVLDDKRIEQIIDLIRCTYENTAHREEATDDLRSLVVLFAVSKIDNLVGAPNMKLLLVDQPQFSRDLVRKFISCSTLKRFRYQQNSIGNQTEQTVTGISDLTITL